MSHDALLGSLLGCALGDSIGLPYEGGSRAWIARRAPSRLVQSFTPSGRGYASDDTDHSRIVLQALAIDPTGGKAYASALAWGFRRWFLSLPPGLGLGTARACGKLLLGFGPHRSGVWTAGNGPAMRAAVLGAFRQDDDWIRNVVRTTTRITHTDPLAEHGALLVARMTAVMVNRPLTSIDMLKLVEPGPLGEAVVEVVRAWEGGERPEDRVGPDGVSGFVLHTVAAVASVVLTHPTDFEAAVDCAIRLGGDTDTVAAIVGGIVGARVGPAGLPRDWLEGFGDWPWGTTQLRALVDHVTEGAPSPRVPPTALFKNHLMLWLAIGHLVRRWFT